MFEEDYFYQALVRRYSNGRPVCNCGDAYEGVAEFDGKKYRCCPGGCSTNQLTTRDEVCRRVCEEFSIPVEVKA